MTKYNVPVILLMTALLPGIRSDILVFYISGQKDIKGEDKKMLGDAGTGYYSMSVQNNRVSTFLSNFNFLC